MTTVISEEVIDKPEYHRPYGVEVGDRVWLWENGSPPLSEDYVKPDCKSAVVLDFRSGFPPDRLDADYQVWLADLAYVDEPGSLKILTNVPQAESSASRGSGQRSYGNGASWHRDIIHDFETSKTVVVIDINDSTQVDLLSERLRDALKRDSSVKPFLYNESVRVALLGLGTKRINF